MREKDGEGWKDRDMKGELVELDAGVTFSSQNLLIHMGPVFYFTSTFHTLDYLSTSD